MRTGDRAALVLVSMLALMAPTHALAGVAVDPNEDDSILGSAGGLRYRMDSTPFSGGTYASAESGCGGPRWHALGGGAQAVAPADQAWVLLGRPYDYDDPDSNGDDGWDAAGYGPGSGKFAAYSICMRDGKLRYRNKTVPDSSSGLRSASIGCGAATWQVTGGGVFIATSDSWVNTAAPMDGGDADTLPDDGWRGRVYDTAGGPGGFEVRAVCARALSLRYVVRPPVMLSAGQVLTRRADCRNDEHVVSGGVRISGPSNRARVVYTIPVDDGDAKAVPDDGWQSRVYSLSGAAKKVTAYAICLG